MAASPKKLARFILIPLHPFTAQTLDEEGFKARRLPYWPESVSYSRGNIGWESQEYPGLSHGLLSWSQNGNPTLSFDIPLATEIDPKYMNNPKTDQTFDLVGEERRVDINAVAAWFTALSNPKYTKGNKQPVESPPIIHLVPEGVQSSDKREGGKKSTNAIKSEAGADNVKNSSQTMAAQRSSGNRGTNFSQLHNRDFFGVLDSLDIEYEDWFPSGNPRAAEISVSFKETIQIGGKILPHNRIDNVKLAKNYQLFE